VGRDKTYRSVQYLARFLAWYEYRKGATKETVTRLTNLKSSIGLSRKRECLACAGRYYTLQRQC
jgi:peroxin-11B